MKLMKSLEHASAMITSDTMNMVANTGEMSVVSELTTKSKKRMTHTIAATRTTTTTTTTNIHRQRRFNAVSSSPFEIFRRPA
jgi:hypothetical protein